MTWLEKAMLAARVASDREMERQEPTRYERQVEIAKMVIQSNGGGNV